MKIIALIISLLFLSSCSDEYKNIYEIEKFELGLLEYEMPILKLDMLRPSSHENDSVKKQMDYSSVIASNVIGKTSTCWPPSHLTVTVYDFICSEISSKSKL